MLDCPECDLCENILGLVIFHQSTQHLRHVGEGQLSNHRGGNQHSIIVPYARNVTREIDRVCKRLCDARKQTLSNEIISKKQMIQQYWEAPHSPAINARESLQNFELQCSVAHCMHLVFWVLGGVQLLLTLRLNLELWWCQTWQTRTAVFQCPLCVCLSSPEHNWCSASPSELASLLVSLRSPLQSPHWRLLNRCTHRSRLSLWSVAALPSETQSSIWPAVVCLTLLKQIINSF